MTKKIPMEYCNYYFTCMSFIGEKKPFIFLLDVRWAFMHSFPFLHVFAHQWVATRIFCDAFWGANSKLVAEAQYRVYFYLSNFSYQDPQNGVKRSITTYAISQVLPIIHLLLSLHFICFTNSPTRFVVFTILKNLKKCSSQGTKFFHEEIIWSKISQQILFYNAPIYNFTSFNFPLHSHNIFVSFLFCF